MVPVTTHFRIHHRTRYRYGSWRIAAAVQRFGDSLADVRNLSDQFRFFIIASLPFSCVPSLRRGPSSSRGFGGQRRSGRFAAGNITTTQIASNTTTTTTATSNFFQSLNDCLKEKRKKNPTTKAKHEMTYLRLGLVEFAFSLEDGHHVKGRLLGEQGMHHDGFGRSLWKTDVKLSVTSAGMLILE